MVALTDTSPEVRKYAAMRLGKAGATTAVEPLFYLALHDGDFGVQDAAIKALASIGGPAVDHLTSLLETGDPAQQRASVAALGAAGDARSVSALVSFIERGNADSGDLGQAATAPGQIGPPAYESVAAALGEADPWALQYLVQALGKIKDPRAIQPLVMLLRKGYPASWVASALADIGPPAIPALVNMLRGSPPADHAGDAEGRPGHTQRTGAENAARIAGEALGRIGAPAVDPLIDAMQHGEGEIRLGAARGLSLVNDQRANAALATTVQLGDLRITAAVYLFIMRRGRDADVELLVRALDGYGDTQMAEDFLNCRIPSLEQAARDWAARHGYEVTSDWLRGGGNKWGGRQGSAGY
jgi:HEAT repeat protein